MRIKVKGGVAMSEESLTQLKDIVMKILSLVVKVIGQLLLKTDSLNLDDLDLGNIDLGSIDLSSLF